jgi:hypothetical protein
MCGPKQPAKPGTTGARLTGTVTAGGRPAARAYVQIRNLAGDFQGELRADADGRPVLYPIPGRWRLVSWLPGAGRSEQEIDMGKSDQDVVIELVPTGA